MIQSFRPVDPRVLLGCVVLAGWHIYGSCPPAAAQTVDSVREDAADTRSADERRRDMVERLTPDVIAADLEQFRRLLKTEWLIATLVDADFDAAISDLGKRAAGGMTRGEFIVELQKIIALGNDGHALMSSLRPAIKSVHEDQGFHGFYIEVCGDDYIAYTVEHLTEGAVNPDKPWRLKPLREGFPYITAIDGVPIEKWIETISRFLPKGPELSVRWRCVEWIHCLPYWREQMSIPQSKTIRVQLTSHDQAEQIEIDAPVKDVPRGPTHPYIPKPDWKLIDDQFGYIWVRNSAAKVGRLILETMPKLRDTKGLVIDLRGNEGGSGIETLQFMAGYLLPPDEPRRVVASEVGWPTRKESITPSFKADDKRVTEAGRKMIADYQERFKPRWNPPTHRAIEWRHVLLARPEAEPGIYPFNVPEFPREDYYHYGQPVVVLMDHRNFSAGELFVAGIRELDNVTLVGSPTTSAAGTSPELFKLDKSGLRLILGYNYSWVQPNGDFIDGNGIEPDVVVHPDVDYYLGVRDRALEKAVEILKEKAAARN